MKPPYINLGALHGLLQHTPAAPKELLHNGDDGGDRRSSTCKDKVSGYQVSHGNGSQVTTTIHFEQESSLM